MAKKKPQPAKKRETVKAETMYMAHSDENGFWNKYAGKTPSEVDGECKAHFGCSASVAGLTIQRVRISPVSPKKKGR